ncbi:uroporphyrinogen-III C-methyltransferase [Endozoicomonas sp. OPT23]|uniref:uroporphyrinogen-III C-methyltransferase n=1 Tax=Endozoicomonas sp. OPT23 TaxID=2072845 RepID=UPI00129B4561
MSKKEQKSSDSDKEVVKAETEKAAEPAKKTTTPVAKPRSKPAKSGRGIAALALVLSVSALSLSAYIGWRAMPLEKKQPSLITGQEQLTTQIARQQARLTEAIRQLAPLKSQIDSQQERNERLLKRTDSLAQSVSELAGTSRSGWKLAEVEYLLRLANQQMLMGSDIKAAKKLLINADSILVDLDDFRLFSVREALAEDISLLNAIPEFDQQGLYLRLEAVSKQVSELPVLQKAPSLEAEPSEQNSSASASSGDWKAVSLEMMKNVWNSFSSLFRFTPNRDEPVKALLSPAEDSMIRQNLSLLLEQGKLALLTRDQVIFESSLKQASNWIKRYFVLSGTAASGMVEELVKLQTLDISPAQPDISHSLVALKEYQTADTLPEPSQEPSQNTVEPIKAEPPVAPVIAQPPAQPSAATEATKQPGVFVPEGDKQQ